MAEASWCREDSETDRTLEENWLFRLRRERFRSRVSGKSHDFFVLHLADAVHVVALTPDRRLILVRQFRAGSGRDSLETPGGLVDRGEDPSIAGARELLEETGYAGDPPVVLGTVWSNPSLLSSRITTILITNARPRSEPSLDLGEEVRVEFVPASAVPRMIREGRIDHALAVQGLFWWMASEVPGSPFAVGARGSLVPRYGIASLLYLVALCALMFKVGGALGKTWVLAVAGTTVLPVSVAIVYLVLDPPYRSVLLRRLNHSPRRSLLRLLAVVVLAGIFATAVLAFAIP